MPAILLCLLASMPPAAGHTALVSSEPANGAELASPPSEIVLRFETRVRPPFSKVEVTGPSGTSVRSEAPPAASDEERVLRAPLRADLPPGRYEVRWSVVSADGHRKEGTLSFLVKAPAV